MSLLDKLKKKPVEQILAQVAEEQKSKEWFEQSVAEREIKQARQDVAVGFDTVNMQPIDPIPRTGMSFDEALKSLQDTQDDRFKVNEHGGRKEIAGKRYNHHVPKSFILDLAEHLEIPNKPSAEYPNGKYPHGNWQLGLTEADCIDSIERHTDALKRGELIDPSTGTSHALGVAANAMMYHELRRIGRLELNGDKVFIERFYPKE